MAGRIVAVDKRVGWLSSGLRDGKRMLILPGDEVEYVRADIGDVEILIQFALDEVVRVAPLSPVCTGRFLDGPLAGLNRDYVTNRLDAVCQVIMGGLLHRYRVVALAAEGRLAELRHLDSEKCEASQ